MPADVYAVDTRQHEIEEHEVGTEPHGVVERLATGGGDVGLVAFAGQIHRKKLGDVLFVLVDWARWHGIEAEDAMRWANEKFVRRFGVIERNVATSGREWQSFTLDELEAFPDAA